MAVSSGTGTFSINGLSSGFDTASIIQGMLAVKKIPAQNAQADQATITLKQNAWQTLNTRLSGLDSAAAQLQDPSAFQARAATSSDPNVSVTATAGQDVGNYQISVVQLAQQNQQISQGYSSADAAIGTGTVSLQVGTAQFPPITVDSTDNTLTGLRDAINHANLGVQASILDAGAAAGANEFRLVLNSATSGQAGQITLSSNLSGATAPSMTDLQVGQDAKISVGTGAAAVTVASSDNIFTDVIPGVTIRANGKTTSPASVSVTKDSSSVKATVNNMLDQYNQLVDYFASQDYYDPKSQQSGTLFGDFSLLSMQSKITDTLTGRRQIDGSTLNSLTSVGITADDKGHLTVTDPAAFAKAATDPSGLQKLLNDPQTGVVTQLRAAVTQMTAPSSGTLAQIDKALTDQYDQDQETIDSTNAAVAQSQNDLQAIFDNMEQTLSQLRNQSDSINAYFGNNNSSSSSSSSKPGSKSS